MEVWKGSLDTPFEYCTNHTYLWGLILLRIFLCMDQIREYTKSSGIFQHSFQKTEISWQSKIACYYLFYAVELVWRFGSSNERFQKQPPEVLYKKAVLKYFAIFAGKHLCWSLFLVKRLQHRRFPVNIAKSIRTPSLKDICWRLLPLIGSCIL